MKLLLAALALLTLVNGEALAFDVSTSSPGSGLGYTCTNDGGDRECSCSGKDDCNDLRASGECTSSIGDHEWIPDMTCNAAETSCTCPWAREAGETDHRPDSYTPATENAPREPNVRDHRRSRRNTTPTENAPSGENRSFIHEEEIPRSGSATTPTENESTSDEPRENEIVRARRGRNPATEPAPAQDAEEEEEETPNRIVRDHRRP